MQACKGRAAVGIMAVSWNKVVCLGHIKDKGVDMKPRKPRTGLMGL